MIEVRYAGVVVGRSAIVRELDTRGLFLGITEPLPVGTAVSLRIGDGPNAGEVPGKVEMVSESQELSRAGMRVRFLDPAAAALFGTPVEAGPEPEPEPKPEPRRIVVAPAAAAPALSSPAAVVAATAGSEVSGATATATATATAESAAHRRIVVDASTEKAPEKAPGKAPESAPPAAVVPPTAAATASTASPTAPDAGRIPAPDPSAFGMGGKKGRKNKRR